MDLMKDYKKYCNLIHLKSDPASKTVCETDHGLIIFKEDMNCTFVACDNESEIANCMKYLQLKPNSSLCIQNVEIMKKLPPLEGAFECCNFVYEQESFDFIENEEYEIHNLDSTWLDFIVEHYDGYNNIEYIRNRLTTRNVWGIFCDGKICGFIGYHDEGSMGLLHILEDYRGKGIGEYLEGFLIHKTLNDGKIAFCQVHPDNLASIYLQYKLGLNHSENIITWGDIPENFNYE